MRKLVELIIAVGLSGSGKTTILKPYAAAFDYVYVCLDDIRWELTGDVNDQSQNAEVVAQGYQKVADALGAGRNVIMDATYARSEHRAQLIAYARAHGAQKITCLWFKVSLDVALGRNAARARKVPPYIIITQDQSLKKTPPSTGEGFDEVVTWR